MKPYHIETLIDTAAVNRRIGELGAAINTHYAQSKDLVLVGLLRGSVVFLADLCRHLIVPVSLDFMTVSSYGRGMESSRNVHISRDLDEDIKGRDVLIVEDIIDTGHTLTKVRELLSLREPASLTICTLLDKPSRREVPVKVDWTGFEIPDVFVVGMGIDYAQAHRNLPWVGKVVMD